ncbi:nuclear transport factor 2 family protein [Novosphingobium sp. ERN07]|uniref:nuclear transport factor 2 family protein n=1 Tax=Novosphingobium sp. ERN07 TaxID=2726187 RepID=UPI0017D3F4E5|nr:nuclear transport factor 2 family protein [Novosphingobium sp. ERN07]NLR73207.1 nuclear transport factor 2 family protein [Novosphingobium sp. ERN07]
MYNAYRFYVFTKPSAVLKDVKGGARHRKSNMSQQAVSKEKPVFTGPEADRLALRELLDSYSDAVNRRDPGALAASWTEDAVWTFRGLDQIGRDAIVSNWSQAMDGFEAVWFSAFPGSIAVDGDTAHMITHTFEYLKPVGAAPRLQSGIYEDRAVRLATGWHFAKRSFTPKEMTL